MKRLQTDLDEEENDRTLVAALDTARLAQAETLGDENRFARERAIPLFREAFRTYSLPAGQGAPAAAGARIRERPASVREALLAALDEWDDLAGNPLYQIHEPHREWLRAVLEAAESGDGWGQQVRTARRESDVAKRRAALEALAATADVRNIPARALTRLASKLSPAQKAALLRRAQEQYPADFWINHDLAWALEELRPPERDAAVRFLTAAVALRPASPGCHLNLAVALHGQGHFDEAIACCRRALELDPKYSAAHTELGRSLYAKGQIDRAIASLHKAIELNPKNAWAHSGMGAILCDHKRDYDAAIACFRKALELDPKSAVYYHNLGNALRGKGRLDEAITSFRSATELDPNLALTHMKLGNALWAKGRADEAIVSLRKAIEVDPKFAQAHYNLGNALSAKGQIDEAIASFRKAVELDPKSAEIRASLGAILRDDKRDYDAAIACFQKAIELDPRFARAHSDLGVALNAKGQVHAAIVSFQKAIELDSKHANSHDWLAYLKLSLGDPAGALPHAETAAQLQRNSAQVQLNLGRAREGTGDPDGAVAAYDEALRLDPNNAYARAARTRAQRDRDLYLRLPDIVAGKEEPKTASAGCRLAMLCARQRKRYTTSVRLFESAFATDPSLAEDLKAAHRYNAACFAALAAAGEDEDSTKLDDNERARLRKQALAWLRADLILRTRQLQSGQGSDSADGRSALRHWQQDTDLASLRDEAALAKLRPDVRTACSQFWADVAALLKKAQSPPAKESKP